MAAKNVHALANSNLANFYKIKTLFLQIFFSFEALCQDFKKIMLVYFHLLEWQREGRQNTDMLSSTDSLPQMLGLARAGQAEAWTQEPHPVLPHGQQGLNIEPSSTDDSTEEVPGLQLAFPCGVQVSEAAT